MSGKISVIVPVLNTSAYLPGVIEALLAQDIDPQRRELIFVDNGSSDGSREIIQACSELVLLEEPTKGSYSVRNRGIRAASGDILAFVDSDCYPDPEWLSTIRESMASRSADVLMGKRMPADDHRALNLICGYENCKAEVVFELDDPLVYFGYTNNMAVRRETMERFGPFMERARGADTLFVRKVAEGAGTEAVRYCPTMVVRHAELTSVAAYYRKLAIYARSRQAYRHIMPVRPVSGSERYLAFRRAVETDSWWNSVRLFCLLAVGAIAWWFGGLNVSPSDT